jgi:hypothetical protein
MAMITILRLTRGRPRALTVKVVVLPPPMIRRARRRAQAAKYRRAAQ